MKEEQTLKRRTSRLSGASVKEKMRNPAIAFICTAACFILLLLASQKYPFGRYTVLVSDLEAQYAPYLFLLKSKLLNLNPGRIVSDFGYSFLLGAGRNFASTFGYYLASPLNLLVLFFDASKVNEFVLLLMGLKISLASAFMCAFIEERAEKKGTKWPILWGIMYAFSSYTMLFLFQIMWLDGYMLLPLLLLMIERYLKNGKLGGVTVVLFFLFLSNYYIAYMAGIYSFFYLLSRMYLTGRFTKAQKPLSVIGRFILRAVFTGLTLCVMLLPVGLDTLRNGDPTNGAEESIYVGFTFTSFLDRLFMGYPGEFSDVLICNMPLVFVSVIVTFLCILYFVSKAFTGKEKKFYAVAFILIYASLSINALDVAWQVFDSPNWFWHREAFVFITFFLTTSYKVFENIGKVLSNEILKTAGIMAVLLLAAQSFAHMKTNGKLFIFNAVIVSVITLLLLGLKKTDWSGQLKDMNKIIPVMIAVFTIYEVAFLAPMQSSGTSTLSVFSGEGAEYADAILSFEDCANASDMLGNGFRSEYDFVRVIDDIGLGGASQYSGYRGISLFNSNSNKAFARFMKQLGYSVNYNYFAATHNYNAPSADAFFSIGSLYGVTDDYQGADFIADDGNLFFYRSRSVLPLAFTCEASARDFNFYSLETNVDDKDYFEFQNDWYRSLFSSFSEDFFIPVDESCIEETMLNGSAINLNDYQRADEEIEDDLQSESEDSEVFDPDNLGLEVTGAAYDTQIDIFRTNEKIPIILNYDIEITDSSELYINISVPRTNGGCDVYMDGHMIDTYSPGTYYSSIVRLGSHEVGDMVRVTIMANYDTWTYLQVIFAYFDCEAFEAQFAGVDTASTSIIEADDGYVAFTADVEAGEMILTSIPYEDGWTLTVDGVETEIIPYQDALISIDAEPGTHEVVLRFTPPGLKAGALMSVVGVLGLAVVGVLDRKKSAVKSA